MRQKKKSFKTKDLAQIAMIVAAMVTGGYVIYVTMGQMPLPGIKYVVMAPYFSVVMALLVDLSPKPYRIFWVNTVFSGIMTTINLYMGLSILCVGILCSLLEFMVKASAFRAYILGGAYAVFTVAVSLLFSKYLIANVLFKMISPLYIVILMAMALILGSVGAIMGVFISKKVKGGLLG